MFVAYVESFLTPGMNKALPPSQLWAARSALIHTFSPLGDHTGPGKTRPIFYYSWDENEAAVRRSLEERGYLHFSLIYVNEVKARAIWAFNGMMMRVEQDEVFRERVVRNAEHLLVDYNGSRVEELLKYVDAVEES